MPVDIFIITTFFFSCLSVGLIIMLQFNKKKLEAEQARFQASVNSINVGFMITDTNGQIAMINTAAKQIIFNTNTNSPAIFRNSPAAYFRYSIDEIQARLGTVYDLKSQIQKALVQKTTVSDQNVAFGSLFLHIFITPIVILEKKNGLGLEYIGAVVLIEDITQRLILERSKDEFFSIASHELRTPLTAIRGNASMIEQYFTQNIQNPDLKEMIQDIHESSIRLINIVNDFLDVSRLEQGRLEYHKASLGLLGLAQEVVKELGPIAQQRGIGLQIAPTPAPPIVFADKERAKQVLINLVGNALKFTEKGGVTIQFSNPDGMVKCSVIDTGKGIPLANQKLLFHKFQQASNNILTRDMTGTGLGLYISKLMVEAMGGRIWLEASQEGRGTVFSFTLPVMNIPQMMQPEAPALLNGLPARPNGHPVSGFIPPANNNLTGTGQT